MVAFGSSDGSDGVLSPIRSCRSRPDVKDLRGDIFTIMTRANFGV